MKPHPWHLVRKIIPFRGAPRDAVTVLASALEMAKAGRIKSVALSIEWEPGGTFASWWTGKMEKTVMCAHAVNIQKVAIDDMWDTTEYSR